MRVTLVYRGRYWVRQALELETLAALLRRGGHRVSFVYDPDAFGLSDNVLQIALLARLLSDPGRIARRVIESRPDAVLVSVLPGTAAWARDLAGRIRQACGVRVLFAGLHPTLAPEALIGDGCADAVIEGEVENVILPLLEALDRGSDLAAVGNVWCRRDGRVLRGPRAELVDLDALPLPDKELFSPYVSHRFSYAAMVSRGCPYQCTYCEETCARRLYGPGYFRRKRVDTVMAELAAGRRRYRFREVIFKDSYLTGSKAWLADLMDRYRSEIGVPFKCFCTIDGFDARTAALLKKGGCYAVEFGLQTWNERIRREVLGRRETNAEALEAFRHCADQRLWYDIDHMFNLPGETPDDHAEGARQYRRLRYLNRVKVHYLVYLPTAPIVEAGLAAGLLPPDARERLAAGCEGDFYGPSAGDPVQARAAAGFAALYKLLPAIPATLLEPLLAGGRTAVLARIPGPAMAALQGLLALRSGDLRFLAYLGLYPAKVLRAAADRLAPAGADGHREVPA